MRILFVSLGYVYPPDTGYKNSLFPVIQKVAKNHKVTLLSSYERKEEKFLGKVSEITGVKEVNVERKKLSTLRKLAFPFKFVYSLLFSKPIIEDHPEMQKAVNNLLKHEQFDIIQVQHLMMVQYFFGCKIPLIHAAQDILSERYKRQFNHGMNTKYRIQSLFYYFLISIFEKKVYSHLIDTTIVLTETDKALMQKKFPKFKKVQVINYGIKIEEKKVIEKCRTNDILFAGYIAYPPNFDAIKFFIQKIFPYVLAQSKNTQLSIVGAGFEKELKQLITDDNRENIRIFGYVDDARQFFLSHKISVVPIRFGGGVRVKILEAMACGIPVVSTSVGAEGINVTHKEGIIIADDPKLFAEWIVVLLSDENLRKFIASNAYSYARNFHDIRKYTQAFEAKYVEMVNRQNTRKWRC